MCVCPSTDPFFLGLIIIENRGCKKRAREHTAEDSLNTKNDPTADSSTVTLLRLLSLLVPKYCTTSTEVRLPPNQISRVLYVKTITDSDGRCVQKPGTYSLHPDEMQLQGIPRSWRIITSVNPQHDSVSKDSPDPSVKAAVNN